MRAILASTINGPMLIPPHDAYVGESLIRFGVYCPAEFETWRPYLAEGMTVVDVGANLGAHTLPFATAVGLSGRVWAFEPQRHLHQMLCGTLELTGARNVNARHAAISREAGSVRVPDLDYGAPQNFGGLELRSVSAEMPHEVVPCFPLDALGLEHLGFLKVDVEGMELDVLHGGVETIKRCRPVICAEADREKNVPALMAWLRLNGYRLWWHRPLLGPLWPRVASHNILALPIEREDLPAPTGDVEAIET